MSRDSVEPTEIGESRTYRRRWWTLVTVCLSTVIVGLDTFVVTVALPTIQRELNATSSELLWIVNAYTLIFGALMLTSGALGDRLGRARVLQAGVALFGLCSVGAYFSGTAAHLIIWRFFMGAGAAIIISTTLAIITNVFPDKERARAIGVWVGLSSIGLALGPIIGGALVQHFNWNSIFLINIPIAAAALVLGWFFVPDSRDVNSRRPDIVGNVLSLAGLAALIYALINGGSRGWTGPQVLGTMVGSIVVLAVFILWERRVSEPLLELHFFRNRHFSVGMAITVVSSLALFGLLYVLTFYMQFVQGFSPLGTGLRYAPLALGLLVGGVTADRVVSRLGAKWVIAAGFVGTAVVFFLISSLKAGSPFWQLGTELFMSSFCLGYVAAPVTDVIMGSVPRVKAGIGSATNSVFKQVAGAIGVAVFGAVLTSIYVSRFVEQASAISGLPTALVKQASGSVGAAVAIAGSGKLPSTLADALALAAKQSFMDSWRVMFVVISVVLLAGGLVVVVLMPARA